VKGADVEDGFARVRTGEVELLVRSRGPLPALTLIGEGSGSLRLPGRPPIGLSPRGTGVSLPLAPLVTLSGRRGVSETLYRQRIVLDSPGEVVLRFMPPIRNPAMIEPAPSLPAGGP
jgi:hypothetical protein